MIFLGLCSNETADGKFILDVVELEKMDRKVSPMISHQCEINIPIVYPEDNPETRDATVDWMVNLFEQVSKKIEQQALAISDQFDFGGYMQYTNQSVEGIRSMANLILRADPVFSPYLRMDPASAPEPGDSLIVVKMMFAIQRKGDSVEPEQPGFLVNFVAMEHWRRSKSAVNNLQQVGCIKGSWEV